MKRITLPIGTINLEKKPRSIFDQLRFGCMKDENGNSYMVLIDHATEDYYAVTRTVWMEYTKNGKPVDKITCLHGEWVRPMTSYEERLWDMDELGALVDHWGNVRYCPCDDCKYFSVCGTDRNEPCNGKEQNP